jgi:hypothetical protein
LTCGETSVEADWETRTAGYSICHVERSIADWDMRGRLRGESMLRARIMMLMAGHEAEVVCLGRKRRRIGDSNDRREINLTLDSDTKVHQTPVEHRLERMRARTRSLVQRHRAAIERLAATLRAARTLDAKQVDAIVSEDTWLPERIDFESMSVRLQVARHCAWANKRVSGRTNWWNGVN